MTDDTNHKSASKPAPLTGKEFASRRTIVKGVASAVPVIMTIGSGQAMAMASSATRCIAQPTLANPKECLDVGEAVIPVQANPSYVEGVDGYVRKATEECSTDNTNGLSYDPTTLDVTGAETFPSETPTTTKHCLVYVDADGIEVQGCNNGGYPVAASCYNSFLPTILANNGK